MEDELKDKLVEINADLIEVVTDQWLNDGLLRDIPILSTAVQVAKLGKSITDRIFLKKVKQFVLELSTVTEDEKREFFEQLESNTAEQKKLGEVLMLVIDRLDDLSKPRLLALIFQAYVRNQITLDEFRRLARAVDLAFAEDLLELAKIAQRELPVPDELLVSLTQTGLSAQTRGGVQFDSDFVHLSMYLTPLGKLFVNILNGRTRNSKTPYNHE